LKDLFRSNQNLLKYIAHDSNDPLNEPDIEDVESLFGTRIYIRSKAVNTVISKQTNVIVSFIIKKANGSVKYSDEYICFDIITEKDLCLMDDEEKPFRIASIGKEINSYLLGGKSKYWLGACTFEAFNPITTVADGFEGYRLIYKITASNYNYRNKNELV
jgi:hypothetical protein